MTRYIALLRGINVGRNNRISMADLRRVLSDIGATDIATLMQSGNAVFTSSGRAAKVGADLSAKLAEDLGLEVPVIVRTADQLADAIEGDPLGEVATNPATHLLGFFSAAPTVAAIQAAKDEVERRQAKGGKDSGDQWEIDRDHLYLWCAVNVHESVFATVKWDKVLGVEVTMRNWSTVTKLLAMAQD